MGMGFDAARARYLVGCLSTERLTRVVDIGANPIHSAPYASLLSLGFCDVWGFEPHPAAFAKLEAKAGPREKYLPYAVGRDEDVELKICHSSGYTSLLEPNVATFDAMGRFHEGATVVAREAIRTRSLDSIEEVPEFDLLKIDVQGGEMAVFEGGRKALSSAQAVITEVALTPLYVDQPLLDAQMADLRKLGFCFHKFLETHSFSFLNAFSDRMHRRKFRSQFVDGDAVFVRSLLALEHLGTEDVKHLAILADAVFDSQDVVVHCLAELVGRGAITADAVHSYLDYLPHVAPQKDIEPS